MDIKKYFGRKKRIDQRIDSVIENQKKAYEELLKLNDSRISKLAVIVENLKLTLEKISELFLKNSVPGIIHNILEAQNMQREAFKLLSEWMYWDIMHSPRHRSRDEIAARAQRLSYYFESTNEKFSRLLRDVR